jgi:poly(beta-D-mannuronate) lyase
LSSAFHINIGKYLTALIMNTLRQFILFLFLVAGCSHHSEKTVKTVSELNKALLIARPGDNIILANGIWKDAELLLNARGTVEAPIRISPEEKGKVILEGQSYLRISGEYLEISGLVFSNGYTPTSEVISFREKEGVYANNCRLTECVIDGFNNPERFATDTWIALYGKNNRIDHCSFIDKLSQGVTITVHPIDTACQNNNHQIAQNYFGYRQNLGSNGGETIRLGTSTYSLSNSGTNIEANFFDRCNGELEIISNKCCGNIFKDNTFWECAGTLSFRHGNDNLATGNTFFGNNKENTGGIRIINERNGAVNNYFYGLKGYRFRGALVVMNGVPESPLNRYNQVVGGEFLNNTFVDCDYIQLCAGKDDERTLPPIKYKIEGNIFYYTGDKELFTVYDDISGISIANNFINRPASAIRNGIVVAEMKIEKNADGLLLPEFPGSEKVGCTFKKPVATRENSGALWYYKRLTETVFDTGKIIDVEPGLNTIFDALKSAGNGDILVLKQGEYVSTKDLLISFPVTIRSSASDKVPLLTTEKNDMFTIVNNGSLKLDRICISGKRSPDVPGNSVISTSKYSMNRNYKLIVKNCRVEDLVVNHSFDFLKIYRNTFADSIEIRNCIFHNISGNIMALNKETDDLGIYNAEHVNIENSVFDQVQGVVLDLYRGGTDESTFGPNLLINHCVFNESGKGSRNKSGGILQLYGVQLTRIINSIFNQCAPVKVFVTNGEPITKISNNNIYPEAHIQSNSRELNIENLTFSECAFEPGNWMLKNNADLKNKGSDGNALGIIKTEK